MDFVARYGADAHKFTLAFLSVQGQDVPISPDSFALGSKFANKIWNATRYLLMNMEGRTVVPFERIEQRAVDRWIYHRLNEAVGAMHAAMAAYRMDDAARAVYEFFWNDFCDWYIEASKLSLYSDDDAEKDRAASLLLYVLEEALRLMHPFLSFISEEIYSKLPAELGCADGSAAAGGRPAHLIAAHFPHTHAEREDAETAALFSSLQELVRAIRTVRSEFNLPPGAKPVAYVNVGVETSIGRFLSDEQALIVVLAGLGALEFGTDAARRAGGFTTVGSGFEAYLYIREMIDVAAEAQRLEKNIGKARAALQQAERKLASDGFRAKAAPDIVAKEQAKRADLADQVARMETVLAELRAR